MAKYKTFGKKMRKKMCSELCEERRNVGFFFVGIEDVDKSRRVGWVRFVYVRCIKFKFIKLWDDRVRNPIIGKDVLDHAP